MREKLIELLREFQFECHKQPCNKWNLQPIEVTPTHIKMEVPDCDECQFGQIADHLLKNGVIAPPCKVGDAVYCLKKRWNPNEARWERIITEEGIAFSNVDIVFITSRNDAFGEKAIGKTVFLTKEEAEAALKGGAEE